MNIIEHIKEKSIYRMVKYYCKDILSLSLRKQLLSYPESSIIPIFIGGIPRSGTTFLKQLIGMHPKLVALNWESKFISWNCGLMDLLSSFTEDKLRRFLEYMQDRQECTFPEYNCKLTRNWGFRANNGSSQEFEDYSIELRRLGNILSSRAFSVEEKTKAVRYFVHLCFDRVAVAQDAIGWIEQTPMNIDCASQLLDCFRNGYFIYVFRDPRDVLASHIPLWWGPDSLTEGIEYYKEQYNKCEISRKLIKSRMQEDRFFIIKFEETIVSEGANILPIFKKLGLESCNLSVSPQKSNIGRWKKDFTDEEKNLLHDSFRVELMELGYQ